MTNLEQVQGGDFEQFAQRKTLFADLVTWPTRRKRLAAVVLATALLFSGLIYFTRPNLMNPSPLGEIALGNPDAPITIIEYSSVICPHCARFHTTTFPELQARYIDRGLVRYIFREYPLNDLDLFAFMLSRCAGNDRAFSLVDQLFIQRDKWVVDSPLSPLAEISRPFGMTEGALIACGNNKRIRNGILWSRRHGSKFGVRATPSFFINGEKYSGDMSIERIEEIITRQLKK